LQKSFFLLQQKAVAETLNDDFDGDQNDQMVVDAYNA
jgi:hypothetical protein